MVFLLILSVFTSVMAFVAYAIWPPTFSPEWIIGGILLVVCSLGVVTFALQIFCNAELYLESSPSLITIRDLPFLRIKKREIRVVEIEEFFHEAGEMTYFRLSSGKKILLGYPLRDRGADIARTLRAEHPQITVTLRN